MFVHYTIIFSKRGKIYGSSLALCGGEVHCYYHNIDYQDAGDGKVWDFDAYITVCAGDAYNAPDAKVIGDTLYGPGVVELNAAILACDLLYQPDGAPARKMSHNAMPVPWPGP
jgi:hypothetical protein